MDKPEKPRKLNAIDRPKRAARRLAVRKVTRTYRVTSPEGENTEHERVYETLPECAEARQVGLESARAFIRSIEFYKTPMGGALSNAEAQEKAAEYRQHLRGEIENMLPDKVEWSHLAAIGEVNAGEIVNIFARLRENASDQLEGGSWGAQAIANSPSAPSPYALAQYLAIRDGFADQWQPQGGIEAAMIDMLTIAFALQMYWQTIAHQRAIQTHDEQKKTLDFYESRGWKSPYQTQADAIDQAHRLADGYNRQFLRVLRQLRDLRRYAPIVIQNNGGQVNLAANGGQQVNAMQQG